MRTITAGTYGRLTYEDRPIKAEKVDLMSVTTRAIAMPRITQVGFADKHVQHLNSQYMKRAEIAIRLVREFAAEQRLDDAAMLTLNGAAADDEDELTQALTWPNLINDASMNPTNLISGKVGQLKPSEIGDFEIDDTETTGRVVSQHFFFAEIHYTVATS
ncbi:MAG: hypothetical protein ACPGVG_15210 [Mycobacterium sp.]